MKNLKNNKSILTLIIALLLQVLFGIHAYSQDLKEHDSTSIISYVDKIIIKVNMDTQTDTYFINDNVTNENLIVKPNTSLRLTLSLDYEFIGASVGFSPKFISGNDDDDLKGESSFTDYRFRFFLGNWTQELVYSNIKGYYIENTGDFIPGWIRNKDPYIQFPNLKIIKWGGSTSYVLNKDFSFRNVVYQTEWQRKSAGSFIPVLDYSYNRFTNRLDNLNTMENIYDVRLAASYYYTFVIRKNWFISTFISPSLGIRFSNYEERGNGTMFKEDYQYLIKSLDAGLQLGYSSKKIIFGVNVNVDTNWYNEDKTTNIVDDKVYTKLYFGYRFNAPKAIQKPFKWINKKFGYE